MPIDRVVVERIAAAVDADLCQLARRYLLLSSSGRGDGESSCSSWTTCRVSALNLATTSLRLPASHFGAIRSHAVGSGTIVTNGSTPHAPGNTTPREPSQ